MEMPGYTKVGYHSTHEMNRKTTDQKIYSPGIPLHRYGEKAKEYSGDRIAKANDKGQKIHATGIPVTYQTGGVPVRVPQGKMQGGAVANKVKR